MKMRILAVSVFMMLCTAAFGQSRYHVPFAFQVSGHNFAAGQYSVQVDSITGGLLIQSEDGRATMVRTQNRIQAKAAAPAGKLVFDCYGPACFLSQVWRSGDDQGMQLFESGLEREMAKVHWPATVVLAARR